MTDGDLLYSRNFYKSQVDGSLTSAREVVPLVLDLVPAKSVCDVGCGVGTWLAAFKKAGVEDVKGMDGAWVTPGMLKIPLQDFTPTDLSRPIESHRTFDLAMSLEVAEHVPESASDNFVDTLTRMAPVVLFSAAIPNQGGTGHINEQWPIYWHKKFAARGFSAIDYIRPKIWDNQNIECWYRQNIFMFASKHGLEKYPALRHAVETIAPMPLNVVHPAAFTGTNEQPDALLKTIKMLPGLFGRAIKRRLSHHPDL